MRVLDGWSKEAFRFFRRQSRHHTMIWVTRRGLREDTSPGRPDRSNRGYPNLLIGNRHGQIRQRFLWRAVRRDVVKLPNFVQGNAGPLPEPFCGACPSTTHKGVL